MANTRFDWDTDKDAENQQKHRVSYTRAQYAFADSGPMTLLMMEPSLEE